MTEYAKTQTAMNHNHQMLIESAVIHLIVKYENNLKEALTENVMAGGDSAARGLLAGMILDAHLGPDAVPEVWLSQLKRHPQIDCLLKRGISD